MLRIHALDAEARRVYRRAVCRGDLQQRLRNRANPHELGYTHFDKRVAEGPAARALTEVLMEMTVLRDHGATAAQVHAFTQCVETHWRRLFQPNAAPSVAELQQLDSDENEAGYAEDRQVRRALLFKSNCPVTLRVAADACHVEQSRLAALALGLEARAARLEQSGNSSWVA